MRLAGQIAALAHRERNRNHPGKAEPAAVGYGALFCADDEGAVSVEPSRRHFVDLPRRAGCETDEFAVPAQNYLIDAGAAGDLGMLGHVQRLAVHRDQYLRPYPANHIPELLDPRMP